MIDHQTIERVRSAADIVDVVGDFVSLRKRGSNFVGLCPFHDDTTPSFTVSPSRQTCKCWSCGEGGNVFSFLMKHEQMSFPEAIKWLGKKYGIEVRDRELNDDEKRAASERESLLVTNAWARDYFCKVLHENVDGVAIGMAYFRGRGLRDETIRRFQLGYSLESNALMQAAKAEGYKEEYLITNGLCKKSEDGRVFDAYRGRVIFPIFSVSGNVVGFGGRILAKEKVKNVGKYINSPESPIYKKDRELYGLFQAKQAISKADRVYLVEGYLDVISMSQSGVENVVASSGTALTEGQIRLISRFTKNVTVLYDGDAAGIKAALRGTKMLLARDFNIKVLLLPQGEDPDSMAQRLSSSELKAFLEKEQTDFIQFLTTLLWNDAAGDPMKRAGVIKEIAGYIAVIPNGITRQVYARELAQQVGIKEETVLAEIDAERRNIYKTSTPTPATNTTPPPIPEDIPPVEEEVETPHLNLPLQRLITTFVIRYGECMLYPPPTEEHPIFYNEDENTKVAKFVKSELDYDDLPLTFPLYARIIDEAAARCDDEGLRCSTYFQAHQDPEIAALASQVAEDKYQLCTSQAEMYRPDHERLYEIIPKLVVEYKYAAVKKQTQDLMLQLRNPNLSNDPDTLKALLKELSELNSVLSRFSPLLGDRVYTPTTRANMR